MCDQEAPKTQAWTIKDCVSLFYKRASEYGIVTPLKETYPDSPLGTVQVVRDIKLSEYSAIMLLGGWAAWNTIKYRRSRSTPTEFGHFAPAVNVLSKHFPGADILSRAQVSEFHNATFRIAREEIRKCNPP